MNADDANEWTQMKAETYVNVDIINYINWLRSVNCGIALISPSKIDWLIIVSISRAHHNHKQLTFINIV